MHPGTNSNLKEKRRDQSETQQSTDTACICRKQCKRRTRSNYDSVGLLQTKDQCTVSVLSELCSAEKAIILDENIVQY